MNLIGGVGHRLAFGDVADEALAGLAGAPAPIDRAIEAFVAENGGVRVEGPFPADTLFPKFRDAAAYDAVVAMYHDQGLIPLKTLHFGAAANITLGLPVPRTSVDHGSAYDIAGTGAADASSMRYALEAAAKFVRQVRRHDDSNRATG